MKTHNHFFHLVNYSPWPILSALSTMILMSGSIMMFYKMSLLGVTLGLITTISSMAQWWRDVTREATYEGCHTKGVMKGLKLGMLLFIISEILFFVSFFWSFYHSSLNPSLELGLNWPPTQISPFNPLKIPLLNTIILLTSGISITWCHNSLIYNNLNQAKMSLLMTVMLGIYFSILQYMEYMESSFMISDSIYGTTFFMMTGFHGIHVIIGTLFLMICWLRLKTHHFSENHHLGLEMAAWYWHFVDIVWLFLYLSIYWWGS